MQASSAPWTLLSCCLLVFAGCAKTDHPIIRSGNNAPKQAAESETMRVVRGETVVTAPLTPEPGDIWADLDFLKRPGTTSQSASLQAEPRQPAPSVSVRHSEAPSTPSATPPGLFSVQLTAATSEAAALGEWQHLRQMLPDIIGTRAPSVVAAEVNGRTVWRLRTGGFASSADASAFCNQLQSQHAPCWVIRSAT